MIYNEKEQHYGRNYLHYGYGRFGLQRLPYIHSRQLIKGTYHAEVLHNQMHQTRYRCLYGNERQHRHGTVHVAKWSKKLHHATRS